jgi:amidophosphoribosyltransferase
LATHKSLGGVGQGGDFAGYVDSATGDYEVMVEEIRKRIGFTTLRFVTLDEMVRAVVEAPNNKDLKREDLCTYCWTGSF